MVGKHASSLHLFIDMLFDSTVSAGLVWCWEGYGCILFYCSYLEHSMRILFIHVQLRVKGSRQHRHSASIRGEFRRRMDTVGGWALGRSLSKVTSGVPLDPSFSLSLWLCLCSCFDLVLLQRQWRAGRIVSSELLPLLFCRRLTWLLSLKRRYLVSMHSTVHTCPPYVGFFRQFALLSDSVTLPYSRSPSKHIPSRLIRAERILSYARNSVLSWTALHVVLLRLIA